jgi:hypothetical protein
VAAYLAMPSPAAATMWYGTTYSGISVGGDRTVYGWGVTDVWYTDSYHTASITTWLYSPGWRRAVSGGGTAFNFIRVDVYLPPDPNDLGTYCVSSTHSGNCPFMGFLGTANTYACAPNLPSISGPQTVWWFNGVLPSGYQTIIGLTASPAGASSYSWAITAGSDKAAFSQFTGNTAMLVGTALSLAPGDVKVKVTVGGATSPEFAISVRGPQKLVAGNKLHSPLSGYGYASQIWYTIRDNFNINMPSSVAFCEEWTTALDNRYPGTNWPRPPAHGDTTGNSEFFDYISGPGINDVPPPYPTPTAPTGGMTEVQRSGQAWRVGSLSPGHGARVQSDTWHRYVDHGDNDGITSPAP